MANIVVKWSQLITPIDLTLVLILLLVMIVFHNFFRHSYYKKLKRAPGPFPLWPLLGNLPLLRKLPHRDFYNLSKTYGDIMELKLGSIRTIIISSPRLAKEVFNTHDQAFSFRPLPTTLNSFTYGGLSAGWTYKTDDYWQRLRKMEVLQLFCPKSINASKHIRDEEISSLMHDVFEDCKEGKPTNMRTRLFDTSMNMMTRLLFGKRYFGLKLSNKKSEEFKDIILKELAIIGIFNIGDFVPLLRPFDLQGITSQSKKLRLKIDQFFDEMIQDRLKQNGLNDSKDFLNAMLSLPKTHGFGDRLGDNIIKAIFNESILAGTDTTATTTEWAIAELLKHPQFAQKAQEELDGVVGFERVVDESDIPQLKYLQAIVKETFRLHPPTPLLLPHENIEGREVGGYHIPPKTLLYVNAWAIHRDSSIYENPLEFNPERFVGSNIDLKGKDFQLLPFGSGRRVCPGRPFGLITVQMELARFLHTFTFKLPKGESSQDMDMTEVFSLTTPKAIPLHVVATARLPLHLYVAPQFTTCGN
ncbi:unnamed protein product [Sphagnum balticum]